MSTHPRPFRPEWRPDPTRLAFLALTTLMAASLAATPAVAQGKSKGKGEAAPATTGVRTGLENLEKQVKEFTLANGLKFIVVERNEAPVFSFQTVVNSGAANDAVGTTGMAHMFEHMAFKGTPWVGGTDYEAEKGLIAAEEKAWDALLAERRKGPKADPATLAKLEADFKAAQEAARAKVETNAFTAVLEQNGAQGLNAFTANDITAYFYSLPSNRLELWALMEGGRMTYPVFREFYKERDVVYEERRMRYESSPTGRLFWEFITSAFIAHPYGFGGIGYPSDLKTFSRTESEEFYKKHYVARNMCVAVVGDVKLPEVERLGQKYFSGLSDAPAPPPIDTVEPEQLAERRLVMEDPAQPFVFIGWKVPAATDPSYKAYQAAADLLAGGDYARLQKTLVKEKKIAAQVFGQTGFPGERYPNLMFLVLVPAAGQDPAVVEQEAYKVIEEAMTTKPFTMEELDGFKVRTRASMVNAADGNQSLAGSLAQAQMLHGDWREFFREAERVQGLRTSDLEAALKACIRKSNRTVAMIVSPKPTAANEGGR